MGSMAGWDSESASVGESVAGGAGAEDCKSPAQSASVQASTSPSCLGYIARAVGAARTAGVAMVLWAGMTVWTAVAAFTA